MIYQFQYIEMNTMTCGKKIKNFIQDKKQQYVKNQVDKFQNVVSQNPSEHWKMWKQLETNRNTNNVDITIRQFYETFKRQSQSLL